MSVLTIDVMKKTILLLALFIGLFVTSSGFNSTSLNTAIGKDAPEIDCYDISQAIKQCEDQGRYVLLSFWSSTDGPSRMSVNNYDSWLENNRDAKVDLLAVNFDKSSNLFREIVKRDGLDGDYQYNVAGETAKQIIHDYHLDNGYGSLLIDPQGKIIAHNPTIETLAEFTE